MNRRGMWGGAAVVTVALAVVGMVGLGRAGTADQGPKIVVYKRETCGCCSKWIDHMKAAGFRVSAKNREDLIDIKQRYGITGVLASCHTAVIEGYAVEGHVPADVVERLLRERPEVAGIAVPGMPQGSPGMEGPVHERYSVVAFDARGGMRVYEAR